MWVGSDSVERLNGAKLVDKAVGRTNVVLEVGLVRRLAHGRVTSPILANPSSGASCWSMTFAPCDYDGD
jgi:hypothetical protein